MKNESSSTFIEFLYCVEFSDVFQDFTSAWKFFHIHCICRVSPQGEFSDVVQGLLCGRKFLSQSLHCFDFSLWVNPLMSSEV